MEEFLGPWFAEHDFAEMAAYMSSTMVAYRRGKVFMRFSYWPTDAPDFTIMAGLGELKDGFGLFGPRKPLLHGMGLWETISNPEERAFLREPFHDREELSTLMQRIRDEALRHALPLLDDRLALNRAIRGKK
ncbi:MAG: hypothetical protein ACR2MY_05670 [Candidatus Dormibacteria bacterium]